MTLHVAIRHTLGDFSVDVAFTAPAGVTALFGRSGAGKTTIVNAVAGLLRPDAGRIAFDGEAVIDTARGLIVPPHRRRVGYVFQDARLFPHLSVQQNLAYGRRFSSVPDDPAAFGRVVELLGIGDLLDRRPARLSGGETQRVAIGRALVANPRILLMDEPLAALDDARKREILPYLERLRDELGLPIVYVSHAIGEIARLATTIVVIEAGRVKAQGPAREVLADPELFDTHEAGDAGAILSAQIARHDDRDGLSALTFSGGTLVTPRIAAAVGTRLRVRVRANDVMLALKPPEMTSALNILPATVERIATPAGGAGAVEVVLRCGRDRILAAITKRSLARLDLSPGTPCYAVVKSIAVQDGDIGIFQHRDGPCTTGRGAADTSDA